MSTEIADIQGRHEFDKDVAKREVGYKPATLHIKTFYGGEPSGKLFQLAIHQEDGSDAAIQLTREGIVNMIQKLVDAL